MTEKNSTTKKSCKLHNDAIHYDKYYKEKIEPLKIPELYDYPPCDDRDHRNGDYSSYFWYKVNDNDEYMEVIRFCNKRCDAITEYPEINDFPAIICAIEKPNDYRCDIYKLDDSQQYIREFIERLVKAKIYEPIINLKEFLNKVTEGLKDE